MEGWYSGKQIQQRFSVSRRTVTYLAKNFSTFTKFEFNRRWFPVDLIESYFGQKSNKHFAVIPDEEQDFKHEIIEENIPNPVINTDIKPLSPEAFAVGLEEYKRFELLQNWKPTQRDIELRQLKQICY